MASRKSAVEGVVLVEIHDDYVHDVVTGLGDPRANADLA